MIFIENNYCVYIHTNKINNKKYIGVTKLDPEQRWKNGMGYKKQSFYNAIMKYGWDNFQHKIIYKNLTAKEASIKEQELIKKFQSNNPNFGYNNTSGGLGVYPKERVNNPLKGRFGEDSNSKTKKVKCLECSYPKDMDNQEFLLWYNGLRIPVQWSGSLQRYGFDPWPSTVG